MLSHTGGQNTASAQPLGHWETRWGAIAIDDSKSRLGAVKGAKTKRQASKAAVAQCRAEGGGKGCKVKLTFYNQCSALAWGDNTYRGGGRATLEEARSDAWVACNQATANCKIVYADCSLPVWVQ
jgi:hypothetical protein